MSESVAVLVAAQDVSSHDHLPEALPEGQRVAEITGGQLHAEPRAEQLVEALRGVDRIHFAGHADAELYGRCTLAWVKHGLVEVVDADTIVLVMRHARFVFLNGCESEALAKALVAEGVDDVICWSTLAHDDPARVIALTVWERLVAGDSVATAFEEGVKKVLTSLQRLVGNKYEPKYDFSDPKNTPLNAFGDLSGKLSDGRFAAGIAVHLCRSRFHTPVTGAPQPPPLPTELRGHAAFTGRSGEVDALRDTFFPIQRVTADSPLQSATPKRQAVLQAIRGLGGVGKTELAVQYVLAHGNRYPAGVFFFSADTASELELLRRIASAVRVTFGPDTGADEMRELVHGWFTTHKGWLLIVDNADDEAALRPSGILCKALPAPNALGHVLITSRVGTEAFDSLEIAAPLTLGLLDISAAEKLLVRAAKKAIDDAGASKHLQSLNSVEREAVAWLVGDEGLARLPLALVQAGSAIREDGLTFDEYRKEFKRRNVALFRMSTTGTRREEQSVHTTWDISIDALRKREPAAAELLGLCSMVAPDDIPLTMFMSISPQTAGAAACPALCKLMDSGGG